MAAKKRIQVGKPPLGQPMKYVTNFLKTFPKATKLGSLFPKVKTNLSFLSGPPFEVRAENGSVIAFKHLV